MWGCHASPQERDNTHVIYPLSETQDGRYHSCKCYKNWIICTCWFLNSGWWKLLLSFSVMAVGMSRNNTCNNNTKCIRVDAFPIKRFSVSVYTWPSGTGRIHTTILWHTIWHWMKNILWSAFLNEQTKTAWAHLPQNYLLRWMQNFIIGIDIHVTSEHCTRKSAYDKITSLWNDVDCHTSPPLLIGNVYLDYISNNPYILPLITALFRSTSWWLWWWQL